MIESIEVRNWQSLKKVDLHLGRFTVIVGASSSGKSALMRALRAVASNVRGAGHITRGQKLAAITVRTGEQIVTLERSETAGLYRLIDATGTETVFTKLNGGVPEHITRALRIEPVPTNGSSVNFAGQFDRPYLLDETGANVARVLGELTNVNVIFEAVRIANKTRTAAASTLKTRQSDLAQHRTRLTAFTGLSDRLRSLEEAEKLAAQAAVLDEQIRRLSKALDTYQLAEQVLSRAQQLPQVPDVTPAVQALDRIRSFTGILRTVTAHTTALAAATAQVEEHTQEQERLSSRLGEILRTAGECPTCGQLVH